MHAEMAHGTLVKGSAKCSPASTAPSAEFCMPTCKPQCISRSLAAGWDDGLTVCRQYGWFSLPSNTTPGLNGTNLV